MQAPPGDSLQPEATGAGMEATKCLKPSGSGSRIGDRASVQAATRVNAEQASHDEGLVKGSHHGCASCIVARAGRYPLLAVLPGVSIPGAVRIAAPTTTISTTPAGPGDAIRWRAPAPPPMLHPPSRSFER